MLKLIIAIGTVIVAAAALIWSGREEGRGDAAKRGCGDKPNHGSE